MQTSNRARGVKPWLILLISCVVIILILGGLKYLQISKAIAFAESFPERSETVTAVVAEHGVWPIKFQTIGNVLEPRYVELRNEVAGTISTLGFTGGDTVKKGQLLLSFDSSEEQAQLRAFNAQIRLAELQLSRTQELRKNKLASKNDLDRATADLDVLRANAAALRAQIQKKTLASPFTAVTGLHDLQVGQYLAPNTLITELSGSDESYWVDFQLPQEKAVVELGDSVSVFGRGIVAQRLTAEVVSVAPRIDAQSRNRAYRSRLANPPASLRPGAVLNVELVLGNRDNIIELPSTAVRRSNFGAYVYVLENAEDGAGAAYRATRRQVTAISGAANSLIVTEGLNAGELVASKGAFKLSDGLLTHVSDEEAETPLITP